MEPSMQPSSDTNIISSIEDLVSSGMEEITSSDTVSGEEPSSPTAATLSELECIDNTPVIWGPGVSYNSENRPTAPCELQDKYGKFSTYFIAENSPKIYLTFDEGYENGYTAKILDVLKEKNVSAVFFVTMPYVKTNPDLIKRMIDEGHIVGNHSSKHLAQPSLTLDKAIEEYMSLHEYVKENFNYTMTLFRAPQGEFSERSLALGHALGYKNILWSFAYADYDVNNQPDPTAALEKIVKRAHNGEIMLLHAVSKTNTEILGKVIDKLREDGYTFCRFDL
jgi:peptidoglycan-N-acetylmuramic acid deacetylase